MLLVALRTGRRVPHCSGSPSAPEGPPPGYPIWPRWFSTVCFVHNRVFSNYFGLGLIADTVVRTVLPGIWS